MTWGDKYAGGDSGAVQSQLRQAHQGLGFRVKFSLGFRA